MERRDKHRFRFRKDGLLRWVSHLDLTRSFERMLRRAELPFHSSGGFHPLPRLVFALPLPLGAVGLDEAVELELTETLSPDDVIDRLNRQAPGGLSFLSARRIPPNATARARRVVYRFPAPAEIAGRCDGLLALSECWVERAKPKPRKVNIRPYLRGLGFADGRIEMDIWVTPTGSARADELLGLLGLRDRLDQGDILERAVLELWDEIEPDSAGDGPAIEGPLSVPIDRPADERKEQRVGWGASPAGPVVE